VIVGSSAHGHRILKECGVAREGEAAPSDDRDREPESLFEVYFTRGDVIEGCALFSITQEAHIAIVA
jgi:hypothetical protein